MYEIYGNCVNFVPVCHDIFSIFTIKCLVSGQNLGGSGNLKYTYILFGLRSGGQKSVP